MYVYIYTFMYIHTCKCLYIHTYIYIYIYDVYIYIYTYIRMYTCTPGAAGCRAPSRPAPAGDHAPSSRQRAGAPSAPTYCCGWNRVSSPRPEVAAPGRLRAAPPGAPPPQCCRKRAAHRSCDGQIRASRPSPPVRRHTLQQPPAPGQTARCQPSLEGSQRQRPGQSVRARESKRE